MRLIDRLSLPTYNMDSRNSVYIGVNMIGVDNYPQASVAVSNSYANGHPTKKRRSTAASASKPSAPKTTATTSTASVPGISETDPSELSGMEVEDALAKPQDTAPVQTTNSPFTPPGGTNNSMLPFSPNFSFSPLPQIPNFENSGTPAPLDQNPNTTHPGESSASTFDPMLSMPTPYEQQPTPGAASASGSTHTDADKDPFLTLLEQLAENEVSRGGPSELDFFLSGQGG